MSSKTNFIVDRDKAGLFKLKPFGIKHRLSLPDPNSSPDLHKIQYESAIHNWLNCLICIEFNFTYVLLW